MLDEKRKLIFDAAKELGAVFTTRAHVAVLDRAINEAIGLDVPSTEGRRISQRGIDLLHEFEGCRLKAYPDPGSRDGTPWTIGWGSTGPDITKGTVWTQEQADERFVKDINTKYAPAVDAAIGDAPTTQNQFDSMVCLTYNIGINGLKRSTVLRKHKAGDHVGAAQAFVMWSKNDGKTMRGLVRRRLAEAALYSDEEIG